MATSAPEETPTKRAVPAAWEALWGKPNDDPARIQWHRLRKLTQDLCEGVVLRDRSDVYGPLVGSDELRSRPVHRWFTYKEGFSPRLLGQVIADLGVDGPVNVADAFGGVATTGLAGLVHPSVVEVRAVEYSPFARFVGQIKLRWTALDPQRLRRLLPAALDYGPARAFDIPELSTFQNTEIFARKRLQTILTAREHLRALSGATELERDFFLLGLAAVIEDLSGAMKDGRALRIRGTRKRRPSSLATTAPLVPASGVVKRALAGQWTAMIRDLETLAGVRPLAEQTAAAHLAGDARQLGTVQLESGERAFPDGWAQISCFSPPYLNCIDYTELYKLELWLMDHVTSCEDFRAVRDGTLRSHPSIKFDERDYFDGVDGPTIDLVRAVADWIEEQGRRPNVGPIVRQYFEDMLQVWREQKRILADGAPAVCVVANSTFSRREARTDGAHDELWRLPLMTDVILAKLAQLAGFSRVELWEARELRPRNVRQGRARESLVVAWR